MENVIQLVWMTFRTEFTIPSNSKLIIEGLSNFVNETWQDNERITQQNHNDDHQRKLLEISKQNPGASGWPQPRHDNTNHQKIKQAHHCKPDKLLQDEFVQSRSSHWNWKNWLAGPNQPNAHKDVQHCNHPTEGKLRLQVNCGRAKWNGARIRRDRDCRTKSWQNGKEPYQRQVQTNSGQWKAIKETGLVHAKTPTALSNTAFYVNLEDTGKDNACLESKKTNCKEKQGCA